uniref:Ig-like domain-containing protein n=1 Tax=Panthera tigris altaica TaxID=74533 RepID=A0A8C9JNG2_PANTA
DDDTSPKPTIFLPSNAERKLHKAGTYLCLLEDFFPDVIKIDWKEKNGRVILKSQQGDTMKIKDTYMKYTWLTVREDSMGKEHKCIVKHEKNKGGVDQEILFPSINTGETNRWLLLDPLQLQLVNTSAYYTYLLLLVKSVVYTVITAICLLGRAALCDNGKSS